MKSLTGMPLILGLALGLMGCNDKSSTIETKEIQREEVAENSFKPADLEATIDNLIETLSDAESQTFDVAVVTKPFGGYWEPVKVGANRAMAELDLPGEVSAPADASDSDVTTERQIELVTQKREDGYGGLGLAPMRDTITDEVAKWVKADAPVVTLDSDLPDSKRQLYIGTNNKEAGKAGGKTLVGLLEETEGSVIILGYDEEDWPDGYARTQGAKEVIEDAGYTVVVRKVGWEEETIQEDIDWLNETMPTTDPPLVGVIGVFSNAFRGAEVAESLGYEPGELKIAAFDFEPTTLDYMEKGYIQATHAQRQYYMGYLVPYAIYSIKVLGLKATVSALGDQMLDESRFDTGVDVVGAKEVDEYNDFLDSLGIGG